MIDTNYTYSYKVFYTVFMNVCRDEIKKRKRMLSMVLQMRMRYMYFSIYNRVFSKCKLHMQCYLLGLENENKYEIYVPIEKNSSA